MGSHVPDLLVHHELLVAVGYVADDGGRYGSDWILPSTNSCQGRKETS